MPDTNVVTTNSITQPFSGKVLSAPAIRCAVHPVWLDRLGVSAAAIEYAQDSVRVMSGSLLARHRDMRGHILGWESVAPSRHEGGKPRYGYTPGATRGLYWTPLGLCTRMVVGAGPLQVLQAATQEGPRPGTCYVAAGGVWTDVADAVLHELLRRGSTRERGRIEEIVLAVGQSVQGTRTSERVRALVDECFPGLHLVAPEGEA